MYICVCSLYTVVCMTTHAETQQTIPIPLNHKCAQRTLRAHTVERCGDRWRISEIPEILRNAVSRVIFSTRDTDITGPLTHQNGVFAFLRGLRACGAIDLNGLWCIPGRAPQDATRRPHAAPKLVDAP